MKSEYHMLWFAPQSFIFCKICRMVICPVGVTYNHVVVFFAQERKTEFKLAYRATFAIAKSLMCFKFNISLKKSPVYSQPDGDMYNHRYMLPRG